MSGLILNDNDLAPISNDVKAEVLALNNAHAVELSCLDPPRLNALLAEAFYARRVGHVAAFLLALDESAEYDSPNYRWFQARYPRFVYVDRVVVAPAARGQGHAKRLYTDLIGRAASLGHDVIVCEVNTDPPNPASDAFHAALGFGRVGEARIHGGAKAVRYLALPLTAGNRAMV